MRSAAGSPSAEQENDVRVVSALSKAALAEAEVRVVKAEADARVVKAEAEARVAKAEADAGSRIVKAEAEARIAEVTRLLEHERLLRQVNDAHALLAVEQSKVLGLKGQRHLRGAVELVADRAVVNLRARGVHCGPGVQNALNMALQHDAKLRAVLKLLAQRNKERLSAVEKCLQNLYHSLSAPFHSTGGDVMYTYYGASGELPQSPYALTAEERATAAAEFDTPVEHATAAP